jgi:hypothetical protein
MVRDHEDMTGVDEPPKRPKLDKAKTKPVSLEIKSLPGKDQPVWVPAVSKPEAEPATKRQVYVIPMKNGVKFVIPF